MRRIIRLVVSSILKVAVAISLLGVAIASPRRLSPRSRSSVWRCVSLVKVRICLLPTVGPRVFSWSSCLVHGDDIYRFEAEKVLAYFISTKVPRASVQWVDRLGTLTLAHYNTFKVFYTLSLLPNAWLLLQILTTTDQWAASQIFTILLFARILTTIDTPLATRSRGSEGACPLRSLCSTPELWLRRISVLSLWWSRDESRASLP